MEKLRACWRKLTRKQPPLANIPGESKWRTLEDALRKKHTVAHTPRLNADVTNNPATLIPVIERAPPQEIVPILLHTIHNLQEDNDRGKELAKKVVNKYSAKPA